MSLPVSPGEKRLRIAVLNRVFSATGGGAERYSIALVEQLAARHEIHVFAQRRDHDWPSVSYHKVSAPLAKPRWVNQLWYATATWWATRRGFDVVHSHENTWHGDVQTVHVLPVKYTLFHGLTGWRLFFRYIKVLTSLRLQVYLLLERSRFVTSRRRHVVVTSPALQDVMLQTYPDCAVTVIPPGVTLPPMVLDRDTARLILKLPADARLLAFVANDYQKKGLPTLLQAMTLLPPDVKLAVVGNPLQIKNFQNKVKALRLDGRVFFLGYLKDMSLLYAAVDALAHPTTEDSFAMVVLEAMAHGLPVVVSGSPHCGISGFLTNQVEAMILQSPTDPQELAAVVERILTDRGLRENLSWAARHFAGQWSWAGISLQQELMYRKLVKPEL